MNVEKALELLGKTVERMAAMYGEPVFDEWALVSLAPEGFRLIQYYGPRPENFTASFAEDFEALKKEFAAHVPRPGEFAFSHEGVRTGFDAFICAGDQLFLLFNNTTKSVPEIVRSAGWKSAQLAFVELYERFIKDPLEL